MTGEDLKRVQNVFVEGSKTLLLRDGHLRYTGFVITHYKSLDKLFESGYGYAFIDPKDVVRDTKDDAITALIIDLSMNWKKLYHAVVTVFPQTEKTLAPLLAIGLEAKVDDPYKRLMRPFMSATQTDVKDVVAATMRQICERTSAFASIFQSEAWVRHVWPDENRDEIPDSLREDPKSVEVIVSSMETYEFARLVTVPIKRAPSAEKRDGGKIEGFGEPTETIDQPGDDNVLDGRMMRFLKPLTEAVL